MREVNFGEKGLKESLDLSCRSSSARLENAENGEMSVLESSAATGRDFIAPMMRSAVSVNGA